MIGYYILGGLAILMALFLTWVIIYSNKKTEEGWNKR